MSLFTALKPRVLATLPPAWQLPVRYRFKMLFNRAEFELRHLRKLVSRCDVALDIGANFGLYSYALARISAQVHAFEPIPECASVIRAYAHPKIRVHEVGLSSREGEAVLQVPIEGGQKQYGLASVSGSDGETTATIPIALRTLDSYEFRGVDFVKIDVEGHELEVIRGARQTLLRNHPVLLVEIEQRHHQEESINAIFSTILGLGYRGQFFWKGRPRAIGEFSPGQYQRSFDPHLRKPTGYINNFVFFPSYYSEQIIVGTWSD
jgi:FkbM family methyltransferase